MRRTLHALPLLHSLFLASALLAVTAAASGCQQEKKDLLALPKAYDPVNTELTFNKKNLEAFNLMSKEARREHLKMLKETPGSFTGQAIFQSGNGLAPTVEDSQHGAYELFAHVPDPVLYEITFEYQVFTTPELGKAVGPNAPFAFTGTLIDLNFADDAKPRKMTIRVKADNVAVITDKTPTAVAAAPAAPATPAPAPAP